jgi:hypothetical protein
MSNKHYSMPNANAVRDVPHACFCAKKAKTMMLWLWSRCKASRVLLLCMPNVPSAETYICYGTRRATGIPSRIALCGLYELLSCESTIPWNDIRPIPDHSNHSNLTCCHLGHSDPYTPSQDTA